MSSPRSVSYSALCAVLLLVNANAFNSHLFPVRALKHKAVSKSPASLMLQQRPSTLSRRRWSDQTLLYFGQSYLESMNATAPIKDDPPPDDEPLPVPAPTVAPVPAPATVVLSPSQAKAQQEADKLRQRASELKAEARVLEASLKDNRSMQRLNRMSESNDMIDHLFAENRPLTGEAIARVLRDERWSVEQALMVLERLHERQTRTLNMDQAAATSAALNNPNFQIGDIRNAKANETESDQFESYIQCLVAAAAILDEERGSQDEATGDNKRWSGRAVSALKSRLNELRRTEEASYRRRLAADIDGAMNSNTTVQDYMRRTLGLSSIEEETQPRKMRNITRVMERVAQVPLWVPSSLLSSIIASEAQIDPKDVRTIKNKVLMKSTFFCTSSDSIPSAAVFRGNCRPATGTTVDPKSTKTSKNQTAAVFQEVQERLKAEGLADRIQLFFLEDPEWRQNEDPLGPRPVVLALPKTVTPEEAKRRMSRTLLKRVSAGLTLLTAFGYSVACYALNPIFFDAIVNQKDLTVLFTCIPLFVGVLAIQAAHELAHYLVAKSRGIKIGVPVPVPSSQIGSLGCITPLRSFPPNRAALLDFALSGPVTALGLSIVALVAGIYQTVYASEAAIALFPVVPVAMLKSSFLTGTLMSFLAPKAMMLPLSQPIPVHPLFMVGFSGLMSSALNLLPLFRLDGGRACSAALGTRIGAIASVGTLLFFLSITLSSGSGLAFGWGMFVVFFQRRPEIPVRDEVTEVEDFRVGAWAVALATSLLALAPFPGGPGFL